MIIAVLSFVITALGYFSKEIRLNGKHVFSTNTYNLCLKIQLYVNCTLSLVSLFFSIVDLFIQPELLALICGIFIIQMTENTIYTMLFISFARLKRRKMVQNSLLDFVEELQNIVLPNDAVLIKQFCKEYPDIQNKEAKRALKHLKKYNTK